MKRAIIGAVTLTIAALQGSAGFAADPPLPWAKPLAGAWTLSGVTDGAPVCRLDLGTAGAIGGAAIAVSATCRRNFPLEEVAAWTLRDNGIALIDPLRKTVLSFRRLPDGAYSATLPNGEGLALERGAPRKPKSRQALLDGTFTLSGPDNRAPCGFSVSARTATAGSLEQAGACPARWKAKNWAGWRFESGRLNLLAANGARILSLAPADDFTFVAEQPEGPLFFGPGVILGN
jgi:hypothetical protein